MNSEKNSTMTDVLFFDTYALIEIIKGSSNYAPFSKCGIMLTKLNIFELYYRLLRENGSEAADYAAEHLYPFTRDFDLEVIQQAALFRQNNKSRNLSMADCIGYIFACANQVKFLTGDKEFENMPNVEFVK